MLRFTPAALVVLSLLLAAATSTAAVRAPGPPPPFVGPCSFKEGEDCEGGDLLKVDGAKDKHMTQEACCALCKKHGDRCKVAVVATDYEGGLGQCLLKAGCSKPTAATQASSAACPAPATRVAAWASLARHRSPVTRRCCRPSAKFWEPPFKIL